jgi:hypothetical protein
MHDAILSELGRSPAEPTSPRWAWRSLGAAARELSPLLAELAALPDAMLLHGASGPAAEERIWRLAATVAASLPDDLGADLEALRRGELDALVIDDEPERTDLPETIDGIDRLYRGSLYSEWLGLAYALRLGARAAVELRTGHLRIEWQVSSEGLHRDSMPPRRRCTNNGDWSPRLPNATFSSLACVRPGSNPALRTVVVHRREFLERRLSDHLAALARPIYRCAILDRYNPLPPEREGFSIAVPHPEGGWDLSQEAQESSLFNYQRIGASSITCADPRGRAAVEALVAARIDVRCHRDGVRWRPGRRLLLRQEHCLHGRDGGVTPSTPASWASERWLTRFNLFPRNPNAPAPTPLAADNISLAIAELREPLAAEKRAWLRSQEAAASTVDIAGACNTAGW